MLLISSSVNNNTDLPLKEDANPVNIKKLRPKRIFSKEIDEKYEEKFQELYGTNKEFTNDINNNLFYKKMMLFKSKVLPQLNSYIIFLDLQYLLYTNKQFKELYSNSRDFRYKYCIDIEYRDNINNNKKFLKLEYLLYKDSKFKKLYNSNEEIKVAADQIYLYTHKKLKIFRPYDSFIENYYNDSDFRKKIYNDKEFMIDQILLYSNDDFIDSYYCDYEKKFKDSYDNDKDFRTAYRSSPIFRDNYHKFHDMRSNPFEYREKIHDDKEFLKAIVYVTNDEILYNIYEKNKLFSYLYENDITFQKLFLELHQNNLDFRKKYNYDITFRSDFNKSEKFREHCKYSYAINLTIKF